MNLDRQLTFSYTMNKVEGGIIGSDRGKSYIRALEQSLPRFSPASRSAPAAFRRGYRLMTGKVSWLR
jgi:hypothetical protein